MKWFSSLLKKAERVTKQHEVFGELTFSRHDGWINDKFEFWGFQSVDLLVDAPADGPTATQVQAFRTFEARRHVLLPACLEKVEEVRTDMGVAASRFVVSGLTIPSFSTDPGDKQSRLWTLWFDLEGDDHFMYGVQTDDDWKTLVAFADD